MSPTSSTDPPRSPTTLPARGILVRSRSLPSNLAGQEPENSSYSSLPPCPPLPGRSTSISFAPLPSTDPKRSKKSNRRPLGVAGRSSILRQQQERNQRAIQPDRFNEDTDQGYHRSPDQIDDEALLELGRMMRDAGKRLWRSLSQSKHGDTRGPLAAQELLSTDDFRSSNDSEVVSPSPIDEKGRNIIDASSHELLFGSEPTAFSSDHLEIAASFIGYGATAVVDGDDDAGSPEASKHNMSAQGNESHIRLTPLPVA